MARTLRARDIATFERARRVRRYRPARSEAAALAVLREFSGTSFDPELVDLLIARLGGKASSNEAAIHNSKRFEQTEHESHTDPLTGMPNRRSLDRQLEAGLQQIKHSGVMGTVVVLDLDRLKEINDTYGHDVGDLALRTVGNVLRATVRENDVCARFGGDEFIVVLWDCYPEHEARRVADLQNAVAAHPFEPRPGVRVSLSISAGAARFPEDGTSFDELLAAGDERMYRDKALRRSRSTAGRHATALSERA